jgi:hypothetical protein
MRINNDGGNNYGWQTVYCTGAGATGATWTSQPYWVIGTHDALNEVCQVSMMLHARTGQARIANAQLAREIAATEVDVSDAVGYVWNNTADNLIRLDFYSNRTNGLAPGTHLTIYEIPSY